MDFIVTASLVVSVYGLLLTYLLKRLRRLRKLPPDVRRRMTGAQRMLYLYGLYRIPSGDVQSAADGALSAFRDAWQEMENVFSQFDTSFERRRQELQEAERNLTEIQHNIEGESERLRSLSQLTPDATREVSAAIERSSRSSLCQQIIISAVFFVLGCATTVGVTLLVL